VDLSQFKNQIQNDSSENKEILEILNNFRLYIVEDSDLLRAKMIKHLEELSLNVVGESSSAKTAYEQGLLTRPDVIIIDVVMPEISGIELAKKIKEVAKKVKIIMISSIEGEHIMIEAMATGAVDYLTKPISKETLYTSLYRVADMVHNS